MRFLVAASLLVLAGCSSSHKNEVAHAHPHGDVTLASSESAGGCHGGAAKAELASSEGSAHCAAKGEMAMASSEGSAHCAAKKAELASSEGSAHCAAKGEMAMASSEGAHCSAKTAELASADAHAACGECPKKADGTCDHEAGAKAGRECCKRHLAEAAATP